MMSRLLHAILFSFLAVQLASARSPPVRIYKPVAVDQRVRTVAFKVLNQLKPFFGVGDGCQLNIDEIYEAKSFVDRETIYDLTLKISSSGPGCAPQSKTCSPVKVFIPERQYCDDPTGECFNLTEFDQIQCIPELIVDPLPPLITKDFVDVDNAHNDPILKEVGQEATKFLYHMFDTTNACPIHLREVARAKRQFLEDAVNYEIEVMVETNGADFDCKYVQKNCVNIKLHQPQAHLCPGNNFCLIPVKLHEVECVEVNQIFNG